MSGAATNIGNAQHPVSEGDCANGFGPKQRPHFRLQHLKPGRIPSCTRPGRAGPNRVSDALIVKTYVMSAMRLVVPIGDVLSATDESTTR